MIKAYAWGESKGRGESKESQEFMGCESTQPTTVLQHVGSIQGTVLDGISVGERCRRPRLILIFIFMMMIAMTKEQDTSRRSTQDPSISCGKAMSGSISVPHHTQLFRPRFFQDCIGDDKG